jgi:hypothetical protein
MHFRFRFRTVIGLAAVAFGTAPLTAQDTLASDTTQAIEEATAAALAWLELVDAGEHAASWDSAATSFKRVVGKSDWESAVQQARGQFEPFGARTVSSSQYTTSIPNAPPGEYVVLQFRTAVAGGRHVTETVVPMREADGTWRVSGYFVRPE